jgi:hypothetical protein
MHRMAIIAGLEIPEELLRLFRDLMRVNDARRFGSVAKHGYLMSKQKKRDLSTRSLLPEISALWRGLDAPQKSAWALAGEASSYRGWNLFVQDTAYRLKHGVAGLAVPSIIHQYKVGRLEINAPADMATLAQYHPEHYWKIKKVVGTKGQYEDVKVVEVLALPLTIAISYRSNLTAVSGTPVARIYAEILSSYQGRDIQTEASIEFDLSSEWQRSIITTSEVLGVVRSYNLYLEFIDVRGWFEWDNLGAIHSGTNYARDFRCSDVNNTLTRINYQIEKSWEEIVLPTGSAFDSVYPVD